MYKRNFIWNSIAAVINAAEAVVMAMIVTRVTNLSDAGILSIAFAVGNLLSNIGKFGGRSFHVTDTKFKYDFIQFFIARIITVFGMLVSIVIYDGYKIVVAKEPIEKILVITAVSVIYLVEALEDVIWGEFQRKGKLYVGAKIFVARWSTLLLSFFIIIIFAKKLVVAIWGGVVVSIVIFTIMVYISASMNKKDGVSLFGREKLADKKTLLSLMREMFPLFIVSFLIFYINNSPKYALDTVASDEMQACYGFVAMPVFVIGLLNSMIYQPSVVWLSEQWDKRNYNIFRMKIRKQCLIIIGITLACVIGAALVGIPVLSLLYNTDLKSFWWELVVLQFAGMFLAIEGYFGIILTIMRRQKVLMYGYIVVSIIAFLGMKLLVVSSGTKGAALGYLGCMIILSLIYGYIYLKELKMNTHQN